ncbi:D-alanyl-D-alanine carboxypeptidase family protein [Synechococcus sp. CB0101]|uniref:M15 family metallopeptidase n=1 Tax=Synechococcus sp. CB0101 TaxID=232348 RepID=UPI0002002ECA|nr:M15 family metallopeptidase [Synechococcus sp. CB0101]
MPSASRQSTALRSAKRRSTDDIPLAQRTISPALQRRTPWRAALTAAGAALLAAGALAVVFPQPLRRLIAPPPVQGLPARVGLDGRLLGHFPYSEAAAGDLVAIAPGVELHRDAADALARLLDAAAADGIDLRVLSAYRSVDLQKEIFFEVKSERNQSALERAQVSAPPGFSEHSTGYAVDLGDGRAPDTNLSARFESTAAFAWLQAHANRYHFTLSFPAGNAQGVSYEPWHWRFEGTAEALKTFEAAQRLGR